MSGREPEEDVQNPASRQRWHAMTFLHWRYDAEELQRLLPGKLEVDTYDGSGWVSLTPFLMKDFRLGPLPAVPGISTFPETNVRTYVRGPDRRDGLWFFSLEADSIPTVVGASSLYGVPYQFADMTVEEADVVRYRSRRRDRPDVGHDISVRPTAECAAPSDLDHWLTGRSRAYSTVAGRLTRVPVHTSHGRCGMPRSYGWSRRCSAPSASPTRRRNRSSTTHQESTSGSAFLRRPKFFPGFPYSGVE